MAPHGQERSTAEQDTEMARYGITRVPVDHFHYKQFRYTNLSDAIAQAKRQHPAGGGQDASQASPDKTTEARQEEEVGRQAVARAENEGMITHPR